MADLCTSPYFNAQVLCEVKTQLDAMVDRTLPMIDQATIYIDNITTDLQDYVDQLLATVYDPNTSTINLTYVPPTSPTETDYSGDGPTAVNNSITDIPDADDVAIGDTQWDAIFARAEGKIGRDAIKRTWAASKAAAAKGHSQLSQTQNALLAEAQDEDSARTSELAQTSAIEQSKAAREDIIKLTELNLDNYTRQWESIKTYVDANSSMLTARVAKYRAEIESEDTRRNFEEAEARIILEKAAKDADFAIQKVNALLNNSLDNTTKAAQLYIGLVQSMLNTLDYGLSGSAAQNVSLSGSTTE